MKTLIISTCHGEITQKFRIKHGIIKTICLLLGIIQLQEKL